MKYETVATFPLREKPKAVELRDKLKSEGRRAWMTMDLGQYRYSGTVSVHAELQPPRGKPR